MPASPQAALALGTPDPAVDAAAAFRNADISLPEAAPAGDNYLDRSAGIVDVSHALLVAQAAQSASPSYAQLKAIPYASCNIPAPGCG